MTAIFSRVIDAYARLSEDEAAAWRAEDFDAVLAVQERKQPLLRALLHPAVAEDPALRSRALALIEREEKNAALASGLLAAFRTARHTLQHANTRLTAFRGSYGRTPDAAAASTFSALS